jgi:HD-like signal output (HDOD) protein
VLRLLQAEDAFFGLTHCSMGLELAALWSLPTELAETIGAHHDPWPPAGAAISLPVCVALANAVAATADEGYPAINRVALAEEPIIPVEPRLGLAAELLRGDE